MTQKKITQRSIFITEFTLQIYSFVRSFVTKANYENDLCQQFNLSMYC